MADTVPASDAKSATQAARPLRIAIFGGYGSGNFGNDASFEALYEFLRTERPDAQIRAIASVPGVVTERFGVEAISIVKRPTGIWRKLDTLLLRQPSTWSNWISCLRALKDFDVILSGGTGVFDDFRDTPLGWPSKLLRWCLAARMSGVKWMFVSVGAGPIVSPLSRVMMRYAASQAERRLYRDQDSYDFMRKLGVDGPKDAVIPDLAFLLPTPSSPEHSAGAPVTIGVGIMTYRGWHASKSAYEAYVDLHVRLISWLFAQDYDVRPVIGQAPTDLAAARDIEARLGRAIISPKLEAMNSIHDAMASIAETDMVIASRYHVQIAALKMGRPLISLGYGPKNDALMADVGLGDFCHDVENVDFDMLTRQITAMIASREAHAQQVRDRVAAMKQELQTALRALQLDN
ncbi:MAG: polysaccharide pyruvyl transferase family protein [Hyphomonadaceae bacterium]